MLYMQLNEKTARQTVFHLHFNIMLTSLGVLSRQLHAQTASTPHSHISRHHPLTALGLCRFQFDVVQLLQQGQCLKIRGHIGK